MCLCKASVCYSNQPTTTNYNQSNYCLHATLDIKKSVLGPLRTMPRFKRAHAADCARMPVCVHVTMLADPQVIPRVGSSSCLIGCLPVSSHCARDRSRPCGLLTHRSLSLCFSSSLSLSVPRCLPLSPIEPSFEASVG